MRGSDSELGVIPLAVHDLFDTIQQVIMLSRAFTAYATAFELLNYLSY